MERLRHRITRTITTTTLSAAGSLTLNAVPSSTFRLALFTPNRAAIKCTCTTDPLSFLQFCCLPVDTLDPKQSFLHLTPCSSYSPLTVAFLIADFKPITGSLMTISFSWFHSDYYWLIYVLIYLNFLALLIALSNRKTVFLI